MSFSEIKGQERPIEYLREHMRHQRLVGAYLFVGPEGVGKYLVAKTLAKALNCLEKDLDSCDRCASCIKIEKRQHPDVHIIAVENETEADSAEIKIEYIRQLQNEISFRPYEGRKKVFIINNAHNLNAASANAFLKTLEEPCGESLIILISAKPALLFKTILSRCKILRFTCLERSKLEQILKNDYIVKSNELAHYLAYFSEGCIGRALRFKETDLFRIKNRIIDQFVLSWRPDDSLHQKKDNYRYALNILASWFRDIYLIKIGMPHSELINFDRRAQILELMQRYSFMDLDEILNYISDSLLYLKQNVNLKLLLANLRMSIWRN